jgi:dTDP-glucose 4,6-dehydratase
VISNFLAQALRGEDLTIYGDGSQTRSFCYVTDLIDGIVRLAHSEEQQPVNIGNPVEWTIAECAREVLAITGSKSKLRMQPLPEDDPARRRPDITRARRVLGWEPKVQLREGLSLCIPYFARAVQESADARPSVG